MGQSAEGVHQQRHCCADVLAPIANGGGSSDLKLPGPTTSTFDQHCCWSADHPTDRNFAVIVRSFQWSRRLVDRIRASACLRQSDRPMPRRGA